MRKQFLTTMGVVVLCAAVTVAILPAGTALGEPPPGDGESEADVVVRGAAGDVLLGDSGPGSFYPPSTTYTRLIDRSDVTADGYADQLFTKPFNPRFFKIQTASVNGGSLLNCPSGNGIVSTYSKTTPNWVDDVGVGSSGVGNAYINCFLDKGQTKGWLIEYPYAGSSHGECVVISNLGDTDLDGRAEWSFSAETTCPASVYWRVKKGGGYQKTLVGGYVAAPFEVSVEVTG